MFRACHRNIETVRLAPAQDIPRLHLVKPPASFSPRRSDATDSLRPHKVANGLIRFFGSHSGLPYLKGSTHSWPLLPPTGGKHTDKIMPLPPTSCSTTTSLDADSSLDIRQKVNVGSPGPCHLAQNGNLWHLPHRRAHSIRSNTCFSLLVLFTLHDHYSEFVFGLEPDNRVATAVSVHSAQPPPRPRQAVKLPRLLARRSPGSSISSTSNPGNHTAMLHARNSARERDACN